MLYSRTLVQRTARALTSQALVVLLASCTVTPSASIAPTSTVPAGGTLRLVYPGDQGPSFSRFMNAEGDPATLDPHLDTYSAYDAWELMRCCLARALLSNNGRSTAEEGARIQPDLATAMPEISADGLTWTFRLKQGLHYGPPLQDVEITVPDLIRSFHRLMSPALETQSYGRTVYADIVGAEAYLNGEATSIAGLESPDRYTLVIRLTRPAGDLGARLAMPLAVPLPPSPSDPLAPFGVAHGHDDGYGRFLVSAGPYMLEGSAELDFGLAPDAQTPVAGLVPGQRMTLVRNPSWDAATDMLRPARPDRIELQMVPTMADAAAAIYEGRADLLLNKGDVPQIPQEIADAVRADPSRGQLFINESDFVAGIMMNVAQPPFDDIQVRRAVAFAINKARVIEILGGPLTLRVANHMVPDAMEDNLLVDYNPYPSSGGSGDLVAAQMAMRESAYDANGDGLCDADACRGVVGLGRDLESFPAVAESVGEDLAKIGIELDLQIVPIEDFFAAYEDPARHVGMFIPLAWSKDALSPASFFVGQFYSPVALSTSGNGSLVGATPAQLQEWGYTVAVVPNVDAQIEACLPQTGSAQFECWAGLDQHMMENVLASISYGAGVDPVLASRRVVGYAWDQMIAAPGFDQIVLAP